MARSYVLLIVCLLPFSIMAGGWPQVKGGYFIKLSEWWLVSDQHFNNSGDVVPNIAEYGYYSTAIYAEYGLNDHLTAIFHIPFINYTYSELPASMTKRSLWKPGDADAGLKYSLFQSPIALSVSLVLGLPLGYNANDALVTGDGEFNQLLRIDGSTAFKIGSSRAWVNILGGYHHRGRSYAGEMQYGIEAGSTLSKEKISVTLRLMGVKALGNDENALRVNSQSLFSNFREYLSFSPELSYHFNDHWGMAMGVGTALSGRNIFASPSFTLGIFYRKM